ncbi:MAG: hypothetical protein PVI21_04430 [Candidatus Woesebacteria bacterium]|jgi:hypothetical protein
MALVARTVNARQVLAGWYIKDCGKFQRVVAVSRTDRGYISICLENNVVYEYSPTRHVVAYVES